ncbi:MAG: glycosyltransferase family 39 protein [Planctomycetes bacterium]|nr:glycosyltransferase family 39 protein [Planctomycetota bacterium]
MNQIATTPAPSKANSEPQSGPLPFISLRAWIQIALAVRLIKALTILVIENDTMRYVRQAEAFATWTREGWSRGLAEDYHPLFAFLMAIAQPVFGNFNTAGVAINLALGSLVIVPVYKLTELVYGARVASYAAMFVAFTPLMVKMSAEATSDASHLFFFLCALYFLVKGQSRDRARYLVLSGACAGIAYLSRPDVLALVLSALVALAFNLGVTKPLGFPRRLKLLVAFGLSFLIVSSPYAAYLAPEGYFISRKFPVLAYAGLVTIAPTEVPTELPEGVVYPYDPNSIDAKFSDAPPIDSPGVALGSLMVLNSMFIACLYFAMVFAILAVPLTLMFPGNIAQRAPFLRIALTLFVVSFSMFLAVLLKKGYVAERHTLVLVSALLPLAGCGLCALNNYLSTMFGVSRSGAGFKIMLVLAVSIVLLAKQAGFERADKIELIRAGEAVRDDAAALSEGEENAREFRALSSQSCSRVPFYGDLSLYSMELPRHVEDGPRDFVFANMEYYECRYLILDMDAHSAEFASRLEQDAQGAFKLVYETKETDRRYFNIRVYRLDLRVEQPTGP